MANSLKGCVPLEEFKDRATEAYKHAVKQVEADMKKSKCKKCDKCDMNDQITESLEADIRCGNEKIEELEAEIERQNEYCDGLHTQIADYRNEIVRLQAGSEATADKYQRYELNVKILNQNYVDSLVIALARQGYAPYISMDKDVCFEVTSDDLNALKD